MSDAILSWLGRETGRSFGWLGQETVHNMSEISIRWGLTLLHFLWQGAVIGLLALVAARLLRSQSASVRYWLNAAALLACPMCVAWTFAVVDVPESWRVSSSQHSHGSLDSGAIPIETSSADKLVDVPYPKLDPPQAMSSVDAASVPFDAASTTPATAPIAIENRTSYASEWMPVVARWIAILYAVGVVCFLIRLALALWGGHRLRAISTPVSDSALLELIRTQAHRIGLKLVPVVAYCERVAVPTVIGVLRPMILLPATLTTGLTTDELSAILSHELAHIRRYDLWMNLLQRIIESLLFFHPVVWFLSRRLSAEREICCDDLVIHSGHPPMNYAGALLRMAELCVLSRQPQLTSLSAGGVSSQELTYRIERLMHFRHQSKYRLTRGGLAIFFALLVASSGIPSLVSVLAQQATRTNSSSSASEATFKKGIESIHGVIIGELQGVAVTAIFRLEDDSKSPSAPFPKTTVVAEVKTTTDAQGKYTVGVPRQYIGNKSLRVSIRLEHPGYLTRTMDFCYVEDFQNQEIRTDERWWLTRERTRSAVRSSLLRKGKPLLGQVLLPDGQPAAGAMVATRSKYRAYSWKFSDPNEYGSSATATTDANGHFELLIDEPASLEASLVGHAPLIVDDLSKLKSGDIDSSSRQTFRLPLAIRPTGNVATFKRSPIAGAIVEARRDFEWDEFDMPTAFGFVCATNERGEFTMPPMPAGKYTFSVRSRLENVSDVPIFNRRANEEPKLPVISLFALTAPFADLQTVAMSDVVPDQNVELMRWSMFAQISLSAVETVTVTINFDFTNGRPENDRTAGLTVSGQFNGKRWAGQSQIPGADGRVRLVVPKGLQDSAVSTGHALQRQSSTEPWQPGEAMHLGTLTTNLVGPEVSIPRLAKLRVKLVALPDDIAKNGGRVSIHAFYAREGYAGNRAALQRLSLAGQFQSGNDEYRALALPNEEFVLRVTNGYAENAVVLFEETLMLLPGDDQLLTIDVARKVSTRETTQAAGSGNSQKESAFGSGRNERSLTSSVQAVPQATETGTLEGRISVESPPPQRPKLRVPTPDSPLLLKRATDVQRKAWEASLVDIDDESLLVDAELGLANAFVYLAKRPLSFEAPQSASEPVTIHMQDLRFSPRATVIQTSQELVLDNPGRGPSGFRFDPFKNNGQNRLVDSGEKTTLEDPFTSPETIPVQATSETEIWKKTFLLAIDHPFAAITDGRGRFSIQGLPPGEHQFRIWHERAGWLEKSLTVSVKAGETTPLEQSYNLDRFRLASNPIDGAVPQDTANATAVGIRYPYCLVSTEGLAERSLLEAIASFNLTSQESPTGVRQPPITEQQTRDALTEFAAEEHVPEEVRTQLEQILKSGELPSNVYFRRFTRFDDGKQMQDVWWVRLVVETGNGPVYSVPVRTTSLSARPYTQMERKQKAADGMTLIGRVASYFEEPPLVVQPSELPAASVKTLIRKTQEAIKAEDDTAIGSLFESTGASETQWEFAASELKALSRARIHAVKVSPLRLNRQLRTWSAWQYFKPNLPVVGFLEIEYEDKDAATRRADAQPLAEERKVLSLELGLVGDELRLVNYVPDGERSPPESLSPGPSISGHLEPLADGTHLITDVITNPGTLLSAHLANEEIRQRDFRNVSEQEGDAPAAEQPNASIETPLEKTGTSIAPATETTSADQKPPASEKAANRYRVLSADGEPVSNAVVRLIYQKDTFRELISHDLKHETRTDAEGYFEYPAGLNVADDMNNSGISATWITLLARDGQPEQCWLLGSSAGVRFPFFEAIAVMWRDPKKASPISAASTGTDAKSFELPNVFRLPKFETTIRVVNADGSPAAGVQVTPSQIAWARVEDGSKNIVVPDIVRDSLSQTTDAEGRVTFATIDRMEFAEIEFRSEQHGLQRTFTNMNTIGPELEHDVVLFPAGKVTGTITAGTADQKDFLQTNKLLLQTQVINLGLPAPKGFRIAMEGIAEVTPDEQGRFEIPAMLAGQMFLLDRLPDNSLHRITFKPRQITKSSESSLIEGQVISAVKIQGIARKRDSKEGVAGIPISIRHGGRQAGLSRELTVYARTDANGRFETHVFPGRVGYSSLTTPEDCVQAWNWDLDYDAKQDWLYGQRIMVPGDTSNFELPPLEFIRAKEIRGKLVDANGNPVAKTGVYARARANQNGNDFAMTDMNGEFVLKSFAEGYFPEVVQVGEQFKLRPVRIISRDPFILQDSH